MKQRAAELAAKGVFIGTSSWKYDGGFGKLYRPARYEYRAKVAKTRFERDCLSACAEVFTTVSAQREGEMGVRLDEHRDKLLGIKRGEQPWPELNAWRMHNEFDETFDSTRLPDRRDYAWANEFLLEARRRMVTISV